MTVMSIELLTNDVPAFPTPLLWLGVEVRTFVPLFQALGLNLCSDFEGKLTLADT